MIVKYIAGDSGKEIILNQNYEIAIKECNPYSSVWTYVSREAKYGEVVESFGKDSLKLDMALKFRGSLEQIEDGMESFYQECERDILHKKEGALYIGEWKIKGYFLERSAAPSEEFYGQEMACVFLAPYPFWTRESTYIFPPETPQEEAGINTPAISGDIYQGKKVNNHASIREFKFDFLRPSDRKIRYPMYDFPFDFRKTYGKRTIENTAFYESDFIMTIYGFADEPSILIAGHPYTIHAVVYEGERIVIDSAAGTVKKIGRLGEETNLYNSRDKEYSVFEKIPAGAQILRWSGGFGFDLTLIEERSHPKWNLLSAT